jgi:Uma2 family endonuclease
MSVALLKPRLKLRPSVTIGFECAGIRMSEDEFDAADFDDQWVYELINGVLVVSPIPGEAEVDPNEELGRMLRNYRESHPKGKSLDRTLPERYVQWPKNRRRADRLIWAGLGRRPMPKRDVPAIAVEFVSHGRRNWLRDYSEKLEEYMALGVLEYWVIDRFDRTMTVFTKTRGKQHRRVVRATQVYRTPLLPGFQLRLAVLFKLADEWTE